MLDVSTHIKSHSLFKNCGEAFFERLLHGAQTRMYDKGYIFFFNGDKAERFYLIRSGWVKLYRETLDGSQAIIDIFTKGDIFAETAIFENDHYPYSAEAAENCDVISLPLQAMKKEIEENNKLALDMLSSMARYRKQQDREIEHRALQNAPQRIGCFILRLVDMKSSSPITIRLPYDKTLLASKLGMQPETFSRALNKLKDNTGIEIHGATIEINDLDKLIKYCCVACSSEFPCHDPDEQN